MNRAVLLRIAACGLLGLGSGLLIAALLLSTYTSSRIQQIPLNLDARLVSSGTGTVLDPQSLSTPHFRTTENTPVEAVRAITVEQPSGPTKVTLQVGDLVRRTDKQEDQGLLLALVDTVSLDRATALPIPDSGFLQRPRTIEHPEPAVPKPLPHEGLTYRFPFDTEKKSYQVFDPIAQVAEDANYVGEDDVNGLIAYKFTQNIGYDSTGEKLAKPVAYRSLYENDEDAEVTALASMWGLEGVDPEEQITMKRFYAASRTFWVDPVSGTIVKTKEHANHYYARDGLHPERTLADYTVTSTSDTVEHQVAAARSERDRIGLWTRVLPISFTAAGLVALIAGAVLGAFGLRTEAALIDPGLDNGGGLFGRRPPDTGPMPAAEAETEKLPAHRPDLMLDQGPSSDPK
ncbi:MAG: DUF3068 domain-containing protein [Mycolicibacterium insubricum]|nr:DUF3068 domain-containing protein [Mycobacterium sp.]